MDNFKILIFDEEELTKTLIESYLKDLTFSFSLEKYNEFDKSLIDDSDEIKIIIVDINKLNSDILNVIGEISSNKKNNFIIISYDKSANLNVKAFRNGAKDFLLKPLMKTDFLYAVNKIYNKTVIQNKNNKTKIYTAYSDNKESGKSVFLANLAAQTSDISRDKVLFIDFSKGNCNFFSNLKSNILHNLNYYIDLASDNSCSLLSVIPQVKNSSLYIIKNFFSISNKEIIDVSKIKKAVDVFKNHFKYIFIDTNFDDCVINTYTENISDIIFYIITAEKGNPEKISMKVNCFEERKIILVCSAYEKRQEKKLEQIKSEAGKEIEIRIPKNIIAVNKALQEHKTLKEVEPQLDIVNVYSQTAKYIINRD